MSRKLSSLLLITAGLLVLSPASASHKNLFMGATCGFADNPLASHNRIHHRFTNTSGSAQWVSCPIVRNSPGTDIALLRMEIGGSASGVRFEMRDRMLGSLVGWNAKGTDILSGGSRYWWFEDNVMGHAPGWQAFAFEARLNNNSYVSHLHIQEGSDF